VDNAQKLQVMICTLQTEGPDIRLAAELCVAKYLRRRPLHWILGTKWARVFIVNYKPLQSVTTEISDRQHYVLYLNNL